MNLPVDDFPVYPLSKGSGCFYASRCPYTGVSTGAYLGCRGGFRLLVGVSTLSSMSGIQALKMNPDMRPQDIN